MDTNFFEDEDEQHRHEDIIRSLAREFNIPIDSSANVYLEEFRRLSSNAIIKEYLTLLTVRQTRKLLRGRYQEQVI